MKILYLANGNSIHTRRWIDPLLQRGVKPWLVSYRPVSKSNWAYPLVELPKINNLPKLRFAVWAIWLRKYIQEIKPDILHAHQIQAAGWLGSLSGFHPFVVSSWGSDLLVEPNKSPLRRQMVKFVCERADALTVPNDFMEKTALRFGMPAQKLRLVPWGIETDVYGRQPDDRSDTREKLGISAGEFVILSPRGISPLYNIDIILESFGLIARHDPQVRLVLLEYNLDQAYQAALKGFIHAHRLEGQVTWLPAVMSPAEMAKLYRMADLTISLPSSEGYGFSVYEAIACGCPTIITDLPSFEDSLASGIHTIKVPARDTQATRAAIRQIRENPSLRQQIVRNSLQLTKYLSTEERVTNTLHLYESLIT